jgi:hypothetical protein
MVNVAPIHFERHIMKLLLEHRVTRDPIEKMGWVCLLGFDPTRVELASSGWSHCPSPLATKKADVAKHPSVFDHVGLLVNGPPGRARMPLI